MLCCRAWAGGSRCHLHRSHWHRSWHRSRCHLFARFGKRAGVTCSTSAGIGVRHRSRCHLLARFGKRVVVTCSSSAVIRSLTLVAQRTNGAALSPKYRRFGLHLVSQRRNHDDLRSCASASGDRRGIKRQRLARLAPDQATTTRSPPCHLKFGQATTTPCPRSLPRDPSPKQVTTTRPQPCQPKSEQVTTTPSPPCHAKLEQATPTPSPTRDTDSLADSLDDYSLADSLAN